MDLTAENFADFITRLRHHNQGDGVNKHATANPIFVVQKKDLLFGIDPEFSSDGHVWIRDGGDSEYDASEVQQEISDFLEDGGNVDPYDLESDDEINTADGEVLFRKIYYVVRWEYVCAHFTDEAAKAFIKRKQHDYRELRVYVDAQVHCWEFNAIVQGLLDGKIVYSA